MKCIHCGEEIVYEQNPQGPEVWKGDPGWGCLQAAFDNYEGERVTDEWGNPDYEPDAPYPPHEPEEENR